ncbi:sigma-70 family RNA polymerase sigma factor [Brevibacillus humidisoli]|uniref:RNA polymerase sigma factor n=1 Tax=Brevibacillus humidisoli TaxID=2895522 RepID=UPI001E5D7F75|nr:sigma-70 family RNA polymerase sigma factor [Brevibacillus humidisoli]UFJ39164.1 sigma-70 family RNA polymerase sigma factor [Brevibacillus humidisoli]
MLAGDDDAFRLLIDRYRPHLYRIAYSILRHAKDAEDVTQETFVQIYYSLPRYQSKGLKAWINRIVVNKAIDCKRKRQRQRLELTDSPEEDAVSLIAADAKSNVELLLLQKEQEEALRKRFKELPANYQDVIYAYYFEQKTYSEIAAEQGIEVKSVESKLYRARNWIRRNWGGEEWTGATTAKRNG